MIKTLVICDRCKKEDRTQARRQHTVTVGEGRFAWDLCSECWQQLATLLGCGPDGTYHPSQEDPGQA